jgi:hypothetical protein
MKRIDRLYHGWYLSPTDADVLLEKIRSGVAGKEGCGEFSSLVEELIRTREREAIIEQALEKLRIKTLAMYRSEQLAESAEVLFEQFRLLGKMPDRMGIGIFEEESQIVKVWVTDQDGNRINHDFFFSLDEPTSVAKIRKAWFEGKESIIVDLTGEDLQNWLQFVKHQARLSIDESKINGRRVQQAAFFSHGFLLFTTHEPVPASIMKSLVRFARVFDLTYTRFIDLQKAEAQTKEAELAKLKMEKTLSELKGTQLN